MKKLPIYQVDAFADAVFKGNPAAVVTLEKDWLSDELLQNIAAENNLAETAYIIKRKDHYDIRWFTPATEVDLCGHATLASAHVILNLLEQKNKQVVFQSHRSGTLTVTQNKEQLELDFPTDVLEKTDLPEALIQGFGVVPTEIWKGKTDYMLVFDTQDQVEALQPNFHWVARVEARGIIVTAPAKDTSIDFVSRFFAPQSGIDEDPVTGSAHTSLVPYWAKRLNKTTLVAHQVSPRGGIVHCQHQGERVKLAGKSSLYLEGNILLED
ncbi:PhzF family phenazine biosynthesis protein [Microscilla marina]|uniref:Phenazine biosynthesis protein, PhzF family n=1 Tax=Microscilla marina ATCC 23134 TaxID=313606 RepID=A1ZJD1_MICM2|nr:PhzF family phenazine biosynthesis protein [Microscilla marina]EAY29667.1 phenazine biosynthesis protein, PhzF family [Microscilla marina ATCC 23134]